MERLKAIIEELQAIFPEYQTISISSPDEHGVYISAYKVKFVDGLPKLDEQKNVWIDYATNEVKVLGRGK